MRSLYQSLTAIALCVFCGVVGAQPRPAVVELFTSEGCSSCPPAETYLGELARRPDVLALAFHVDYWDDLGWRDRFVIPQATARQRNYAKTLGLRGVYTPQIVIDGQHEYVGSDRVRIDHALTGVRMGIPVAVSLRNNSLIVELGTDEADTLSDVLLASYAGSVISAIGRGENSGRTLTEYNIVRSLHKLGQWGGIAERFEVAMTSVPADATGVAILVQPRSGSRIVGAATLSLHPLDRLNP